METAVYGIILGSQYHSNEPDILHERNRQALLKIPDQDSWPYLNRSMFSVSDLSIRPMGMYRSQAIYFGATYNNIMDSWADWIFKFESILKTLYFDSAKVHLLTEYAGEYKYAWESIKPESFYKVFPPQLPLSWNYTDDRFSAQTLE